MREIGTVTEVTGQVAHVRMQRGPRCGSCCACSALSDGGMEFEIKTDASLRVGSRVVVDVPSGNAWLSALLLFVLPLAGLIFGVMAGQQWRPFGLSANAAALGLGFGLLAVLFGFATVFDRLYLRKRQPQPTIVEVLGPQGQAAG